jgi:hypothetical protein
MKEKIINRIEMFLKLGLRSITIMDIIAGEGNFKKQYTRIFCKEVLIREHYNNS